MTQHNPHTVPVDLGVFVPVGVRAWQDGYDEGISSPPDVPRTPLVRDPDYAEAWAEGALAGNADGRAEGWRWAYFEGKVRPEPKDEAVGRYGPQDSGEPEGSPGGSGGDGLTGRLLAQACADKGVRQLYLPVNLSSTQLSKEPTGDALRNAGYWHGTVSESLEEAAPEAIAQVTVRIPSFAGLVRYAPAAEHNFFDLLPVDGLLPPER